MNGCKLLDSERVVNRVCHIVLRIGANCLIFILDQIQFAEVMFTLDFLHTHFPVTSKISRLGLRLRSQKPFKPLEDYDKYIHSKTGVYMAERESE